MKRIEVGDKVPNFRLYNQDGKRIDISNYIGKPMVIYFYPKDDTPGCTKEACSFRDEYHHFTKASVTIFGVSGDSIASHKKFQSKYRLPFDLLSDKNNKVRNLFGVPADLFGLIPGRVTYVIDRAAIVRHIFDSQMNVNKHIEEALKVLDALN
jgi:peroxiredoxin Q/BCP